MRHRHSQPLDVPVVYSPVPTGFMVGVYAMSVFKQCDIGTDFFFVCVCVFKQCEICKANL